MEWIWSAGSFLVAAIALVVSVRTSRRAAKQEAKNQRRAEEGAERERRAELRAEKAEARIASVEQREAAQFEVILLGGKSFQNAWLLGIVANGTEMIRGIRIDPASIVDVGVGGATYWIQAEPGEILKQFWFRGSEEDWPETIKITFDHPFQGSRIVRIPPAPSRVSA